MQKFKIYVYFSFMIISTLALLSCYPVLQKEIEDPRDALVKVTFFKPTFRDDLPLHSLSLAIERNMAYLDKIDSKAIFQYGPHEFTCEQVRESLETFLDLIKHEPDMDALNKKIRKTFRVYRAAGRVGNRKVLFTGYFEPIYEACLVRDDRYRFPLYEKPEDLIKIDLSLFDEKYKDTKITARINGKQVVPYYTRENIETEKVLEGEGLEIAWLKDPIDVTFLHIQGSGRLRLPNGETMLVGYKDSNGRPYRSIGRYMLDQGLLMPEEMSMQKIREYLKTHPEIMKEVLNHNPSYVFFQILDSGPLGNIGVPLTPERSIALDYRLFPKGALAFISCQKPNVNHLGEITEWEKFSRFVINQDTGGAIKGAGRADLFWGSGPYSELAAGHMKHEGELFILIKKF